MFRMVCICLSAAALTFWGVGCGGDPNAEETVEEQKAMEKEMEEMQELLPADLSKKSKQ